MMENFVSAHRPELTQVVSKHKEAQQKEIVSKGIKILTFVVGALVTLGFGVGLFTGWIFWG